MNLRDTLFVCDLDGTLLNVSHNDIPMFQKSYHSLAIANAKADIKRAASEVIGSHNEDAVVVYLQENLTDL